ncbi:MAG TPA: hypothetical protein VFZ33_13275 [Chitinophagaceae bacterium]
MNHMHTNPTLIQINTDNQIDYSELYRKQETKQLKKRLRKTRNTLLICGLAFIAGAGVFLMMPGTSFATKDLFLYFGLSSVMVLLSLYSNKQPFFSLVSALVVCVGFWGFEIFFNNTNELMVEMSIHKLFIVSLLVWCFHSSREAEIIRRELHFS